MKIFTIIFITLFTHSLTAVDCIPRSVEKINREEFIRKCQKDYEQQRFSDINLRETLSNEDILNLCVKAYENRVNDLKFIITSWKK